MIDFQSFLELFNQIPAIIGYVSKGSSFPKPLPKEKELEYIKKMGGGDANAKNMLIEHNLRLVAHIAKKYSSALDNDDIISIGSIGLIKAVNTFNADKGTHLATYAARCIENEILMSIRANKKRALEVSINEPIGTDKEGNTISLIDVLGTDPDCVAQLATTNIRLEKVKCIMKCKLTPREQYIIQNRYGFNNNPRLTQREVAEQLGISRSYVSRIEKKAINILHDCICKCKVDEKY